MSAVLTGDEIRERRLIKNASAVGYRGTSYDVRIGTIVVRSGSTFNDTQTNYVLPPQGVVEVISAERIEIPADVTGLANVRTRLCDEGVLALNIGLIDPFYKGPISTTLVNFSKEEFVLNRDDTFLRLTFLNCATVDREKYPMNNVSEDKYIRTKRDKVLRFSDSFLNLEQSIERVTRPFFVKYVAVLALLLATFAFLVNLGIAFAGRHFWSTDDMKRQVVDELNAEKATQREEAFKQLRQQVDQLHREIENLHQVAKSSSGVNSAPSSVTPSGERRPR